jgi:hypothetical protein
MAGPGGCAYKSAMVGDAAIEAIRNALGGEADAQQPALPSSSAGIQDIEWWPLEPATINSLPSNQAGLVREAIRRLMDRDLIERDSAMQLRAKTG